MKIFGIYIGDSPERHIKLGDEHYKSSKIELAIVEYKKALEIEPNHKVAHDRLKAIYRERDTLRAVYAIAEEVKSEPPPVEVKEKASSPKERKERRRYVRIPDQRTIYYRSLQREDLQKLEGEGINKNISAGGIYLVVNEKVPEGSFLELRFDFPPPEEPIYTIGKIARVEEIEEEGKIRYGLGIRFTNISTKDQERINAVVLQQTSERKVD